MKLQLLHGGNEMPTGGQISKKQIKIIQHQQNCKLPSTYPSGHKWSAEDNKHYQPITKDILEGITQELTSDDIKQDPNWITQSTCIVTSNVDKAIINARAAIIFGQPNNVPVLRWKCHLHQELTLCIQAILYDEESRPKLFAYFIQGGPSQILDNNHGNVFLELQTAVLA